MSIVNPLTIGLAPILLWVPFIYIWDTRGPQIWKRLPSFLRDRPAPTVGRINERLLKLQVLWLIGVIVVFKMLD